MYKTTLIHIFAIFIALFVSSNTLALKKSSKDCLSLIQIKNEKLTIILDSIIYHEMACDYYRPDLMFSIHTQIIENTNALMIGAIGFSTIKLGNEQGYFEYRGHSFIVYGQHLDDAFFAKTDKRKAFAFYKPHNCSGKVESNELILDVIEDDSFSFWVYEYIDGDFIFQAIHTYCD